jgi:hypothetical protein
MAVTKLQILRNVGTAVVAVPTLLEGELAFARGGFVAGAPNGLVIGDGTSHQVLIGSDRQLELSGNQTIASGTKTFAAGAKIAIGVADLKVAGGAAGDVVITDGAGNLSFGAAASSVTGDGTTIIDDGNGVLSVAPGYAATIADGITVIDNAGKLSVSKAVTADVEAGTANKFVDTAVLKTDVLGGGLSTLLTSNKLVVPAINELQGALTTIAGGIVFAGTLDASTGVLTPSQNVSYQPTDVTTIDPTQAPNYFWIVTVAGSETNGEGAAIKQDWLASDGVDMYLLKFGPQTVVAGEVAYDSAGNVIVTGADVQAALDQIDVALQGPIDGGTF